MSQSNGAQSYESDISSKRAEVLAELRSLLANLEDCLATLKKLEELEKRQPTSLRNIENQVAPLLDHFRTSLFMFLRSRSDVMSLEDLTFMK
ncbi:hypothetical protein M408DRAFT_332622 [Serendipita vermifera MAFF 305830]|uniref:Uncharacterized protein n=1 Tax=Serendipita vermifera MAFF 305830 TaxID=933852 RepID=A0A0C3ASC2_SERVB|nr:hypothetical protein M408DRAFT_332622 [Serendipita vermifera MAFF 305830]